MKPRLYAGREVAVAPLRPREAAAVQDFVRRLSLQALARVTSSHLVRMERALTPT